MDRLPLTLHDSPQCQSPALKDQLYYPNTSLQSWPLPTYSMDLGDARSDPTTPDGQDGSFYSEPGTLNGASGSMDYFHSKTLSNGSSMEGAPRSSFSDDAATFASMDAASQPHHNQNHQQQQTLRLSGDQRHHHHHHPPSSYAAHTQMQMNAHHGPPLAYNHPSLTAYGEHSLSQQAPFDFRRFSGVSSVNGNGSNDGNGNQNQMHRGHSENPALHQFAFNSIELPPPPPSPSPSPLTPAGGNWNLNLMHNNNNHVYPHVQGGVPVLPPSAYGPLPMGMPSNLAALGHQGPNLFANVSIAQIQQYLGFRNANSPLAYGMNVSGPNMPLHGNLEASTSRLGLSVSGGGGAPANIRPQSQSTMSTPSLAGNSPTLPWSPSFESASQGSGGGSTVGSISYSAGPAPVPVVVRGPPTPPQLFSNAMPPKPNARPPPPITLHATPPPITTAAKPRPRHRHRSSGANTSLSSVRSSGQSQSVSPGPIMPMSPSPTAIPLRVRVNALPKDKRTMFERGAGELWNPNLREEHEDGGLARSQELFLEDLYALLASDQLRDQIEIPDDLVEPILKTILLPRADAHRGSRGGAAGHLCLWAGCGKTIKRLDHSRNHIREHCKSKPHTCGGQGSRGCGQTFLRTDDLKRHQKSHCSILRSGPGRRPRSIRGTRRDTEEEEEERDSEDSTSLNGGDDDDYRPIHTRAHAQTSTPVASASASSSSTSATRELASRLRSQRQRAARYVCDESTEESDSGNHRDRVAGRLHTSNVRRAVGSPAENPYAGEDAELQKCDHASATGVQILVSAGATPDHPTGTVNQGLNPFRYQIELNPTDINPSRKALFSPSPVYGHSSPHSMDIATHTIPCHAHAAVL